jgi:protease-4
VPQVIYAAPPPQKRASIFGRILTGLLGSILLISLLLNFYFILLVALAMRGPVEREYLRGEGGKRIVILPIKGMIDDSTAEFIHEAVQALRQHTPDAVILRVDSGGGGVSPSDIIRHELDEFRKDKPNVPVVASYGGLAASGGYYVSAGSSFIYAEPTCITGSIGVIAPAFTLEKLMDKVGVTPEVITATPSTKKDVANNILRPWNDEDRNTLRKVLDNACARFIDVVYEGRKQQLTMEEVKALANGEIFSAAEAKENKLVDEVGYINDAIEKAKALAGLKPEDKPTVNVLEPTRRFNLLSVLGSWGGASPESITPQQVRTWATELATPRLEYRVDFSK